MAAGNAALVASALVKDYGGGAVALRGVDLAIAAGELVSVMGPSGSGKSTLLHLLGGLDEPTSGDVTVDGEPLSGRGDDELTLLRRTRIGMIFQAYNLLPVLTAAENVAVPAVIAGEKPKAYADRLARALQLVGLDGLGDRLPSQLSGGQQQRVAIARALFNEPAIVLADEPTGNLDSEAGGEILALLRSLVDEVGAAVVMVTHDPRAAAAGDRVVVLRDGRIVATHAFGPGEDGRVDQLAGWLADSSRPGAAEGA